MAQTFNNGESNASIRAKLNANAGEINENADDIASLESTKAPINNPTFTGTVAGISKTMVGLGNVDNTSDANKPVSSATQTELNSKAPLNNPSFTGTVTGVTKGMVGLGAVDNTADLSKPISSATQSALDAKVPTTRTVAGKALSSDITLVKGDVGLGNVDNTSDINKPISALTQNALNDKATPADISTALDDATIFFDSDAFEGKNFPVPGPGDPAVGTEDNPITTTGTGGLPPVDSVIDGNMNPVTSNAVYDNTFALRGGYEGSLQDLYNLIMSGGEYIVERRISLDLQGEFGDTVTESGITWNTWKAPNAEITVDGAATFTGLLTEANEATSINVVNVGAWDSSAAHIAAATGTTPAYPLVAIDGGFSLTSDVGLKFSGLNPAKYYQFYVLGVSDEANTAVDVIIGDNTVNMITSGNYPPDASNRYTNANVAKLFNARPDGTGDLTINFHKTGSYYQTSINLILIEESNIPKT